MAQDLHAVTLLLAQQTQAVTRPQPRARLPINVMVLVVVQLAISYLEPIAAHAVRVMALERVKRTLPTTQIAQRVRSAQQVLA